MNKQSNLYKEISAEQIQLIYEKTMNVTEPLEAVLMSGGLFNTTYRVRCKTCNLDTVLRLGPVNRHLVVRFEENLMEAENYVYQLYQKENIACSQVLACDTSKKWVDRDFMIVKYIPSIVMCDAKLTEEEKIPIYEEIGRLAKRMHGIKNNRFGRVSEILSGLSFSRWSEYLLSEMDNICSCLIRDKGIEIQLARRAEGVVKKYEAWLDEITTPRLVHTDLWEGNILLEPSDKSRIAAVIDADRAVFGDPDYELSCPWLTNPGFLRGYGEEENSFFEESYNSEKRAARRKLYVLIFRLLEGYIGLSEYNNRELYENSLKESVKLIEELE